MKHALLAALFVAGVALTAAEASASPTQRAAGLARVPPGLAVQDVHYGPYHCHRGYYGVRCHGYRYRPYRPYGY